MGDVSNFETGLIILMTTLVIFILNFTVLYFDLNLSLEASEQSTV